MNDGGKLTHGEVVPASERGRPGRRSQGHLRSRHRGLTRRVRRRGRPHCSVSKSTAGISHTGTSFCSLWGRTPTTTTRPLLRFNSTSTSFIMMQTMIPPNDAPAIRTQSPSIYSPPTSCDHQQAIGYGLTGH